MLMMQQVPGLWSGGPHAQSGAYYPETYVAASLMSTLTDLGLTTGLKLCLDAGEGDSYTSGQSWLDLSGNGYDFFLGADVNATATDPTFNGVADALSSAEFFSFDAGDYFTYDTTNETWMQNLHKDSAVLSFAAWVYFGSVGSTQGIFGTVGATTNTGFRISASSSPALALRVANAGATVLNTETSFLLSATTWTFVAISFDEAAQVLIMRVAGGSEVDTQSYSSPASGNATFTAQIGSAGNAANRLSANSRIGMVAMWEGTALTEWQLEQIYNKTRRRFGV